MQWESCFSASFIVNPCLFLQVFWKIPPCFWRWWSVARGCPKETSFNLTKDRVLCRPKRMACTSYTLPSTSPAPTWTPAPQGVSPCRWGTSSPAKWSLGLRGKCPGNVGQWVNWTRRSCSLRWLYQKTDWPTGDWSWIARDWECPSSWIKVDALVLLKSPTC